MGINQGYVYVMINPSYDGIIKIGKTTKEPEERAKELSSATGVATPFIVVYKRLFNNCHLAELIIHNHFTELGHRINNSREFFSTPIDEAINFIVSLSDNYDNESYQEEQHITDNEDLKETFYRLALDYELGTDNTFIDYDKAIQYYQKAADLGHIKAYNNIGDIYEFYLHNDKKAIDYYKLSVERGYFLSYVGLGIIFLSSKQYFSEQNQYIAWNNFIQAIQDINSDLKDLLYKDISTGLYDLIFYYQLYNKSIPNDWISTLSLYKLGILDYTIERYNKKKDDYDNKYNQQNYDEAEEYVDYRHLQLMQNILDFIYNI